MKKTSKNILTAVLFCLFSLNSITSNAQAGKPVTVIVSLTPPYTPFLNEYASFETNKLQVTLITNDSRMQNYPVKLQMFIQRYGTGIVMQTAEYAAIPPLYLTGGTSETLDGASLAPYFSAQNNVFGGFDQAQYIRTGRIPDGQYRIGFRVTDAKRSDVILSETAYSQPGWFLLNDPPQLNLPLNGAVEEVQNIQNVKLEWFPRHLGSLNSSFAVNYRVELYALRVPGIDPATVAASLPPDFTTVTAQSNVYISQNDYLLEPGTKYAWRVKAFSDDGLTLFQNNGYSEVRSFVYGSLCPEVKNIQANILGTDEVEFSWDTDPKQTTWKIQLRKENSTDNWYTQQTNTIPLNIKNILSEGTPYEYRIKALCNFNESDYSPLKTFSAEVFELPENFNCGTGDTLEITNFNPKLSLFVGEIIYNGKFPVKLTEISGSNGIFSGKGRMRIPMLANVQVNMQFENIKVNELNQVYEGEMVSVYNPDSPFFIDDITDYLAEGDQVGNIITGQDSAAITLDYPIDDNTTIIVSNDSTIIINGSTVTVDDLASGTTIEDSDGTLYAVDENGNITEIGTSGGSTSPEDYNNTASLYDQLDSTITLVFENNGSWAFDNRNPDYADSPFDKEYQKLGNYYVPWKFIPLGKSDKLKARITKGNIEDPEKVKFLTPAGTEFIAQYRNGYYEFEATGGKTGDGIEVYAIYMPDDSTKRSLGKLRIASYPRKEMTVTCIPVGDFSLDNKISEELLNQIYAPYYIRWTVTTDAPFTDTSWDTGDPGLQATGSGFWSEYTDEMQALKNAYTEQRGTDEKSLYLFFFKNGNSDEDQLLGDMPLRSRFGFIFNAGSESSNEITKTAAHELAHGAFQLKHTFSNKYNIEKYSTQNLMDYGGGVELVKYQWDVIHDPQNKLFNWMQGEGEGEQLENPAIAEYFNVQEKGWQNFAFLSPVGTAIIIDGVTKVLFNEDGGLMNFKKDSVNYLAVFSREPQEFIGYIDASHINILDKYQNIIKSGFLSEFNQNKFTGITYAPVGKTVVAIAKKRVQDAYLNCVMEARWVNQHQDNYYTGIANPPFIPDNAEITYISGNQCVAVDEAGNLIEGKGKAIFLNLSSYVNADQLNELVNFANTFSAKVGDKIFAVYWEDPDVYSYNNISYYFLKYLKDNQIFTWQKFRTVFKEQYDCSARDVDIIFSTVDLWEDIDKDTYNAFSVDWTSYTVPQITNKDNLSDALERLEYVVSEIHAINPSAISEVSYSNIIRYIAECIENPELALSQKLHLNQTFKEIYAYLGAYSNYEYSLNDLIAQLKQKKINSVFYYEIKKLESIGLAAPVSTHDTYEQYVAYYNTDSAYFLGQQYESMMGVMYLLYGISQTGNMTAEAIRQIKIQRYTYRTAINNYKLLNTKISFYKRLQTNQRLSQDIKYQEYRIQKHDGNATNTMDYLEQRIGKNQIQHQIKNEFCNKLKQTEGVTDIRVNQTQSSYFKKALGLNRPDIQFIYGRRRYYIELDTRNSKRGQEHYIRITANDPSASSNELPDALRNIEVTVNGQTYRLTGGVTLWIAQ